MKKHSRIAFLIVVVGITAAVAWRYIKPILNDQIQTTVSDASGKKGTITIGIDGWVGYFPLCSSEMKKRLYRAGYGLKCIDDAANYDDRFKKLKKDEYQFAVATVDSYLLNAENYDYPGAIVSVIDESKGGDAIVAWSNSITSIDDLKSNEAYSVAYTPNSPSHHLMKAVITHFDIQNLKNNARKIETEGSQAALNLLLDKKTDVAILWEPDVTKALTEKGIVRLLGTEDTRQLIVDILIASQTTLKNNPDLVKLVLKEFYSTLKYYRDHHDELIDNIASQYNVDKKQANALLAGVKWAMLNDNAEIWYGVAQSSGEELVASIESAIDILVANNDFKNNPLPDDDPYRIINSHFVQELYEQYSNTGGFTTPGATVDNAQNTFIPLSNAEWERLDTVGSLKTRHIVFASGTSELTFTGKQQIDEQINDLNHYPNFRIEIRGHTGINGNKEANMALSNDRAESVLRYIKLTHGLENNRARAVGFGPVKPLKRQPDESSRRYNSRLSRVEIALVREAI